jgi:mono/diheme cytochrome c family protein
LAADSADGVDRHGMVNDMPIPSDAAALENGKDRYQARCSYCHRPDGRGGSSSVCLACQKYKWGSKSSDIYATIAAGRPNTKMGAFATSLSQEEIMNIIGYIRYLQEWKIKDDLAAAKTN